MYSNIDFSDIFTSLYSQIVSYTYCLNNCEILKLALISAIFCFPYHVKGFFGQIAIKCAPEQTKSIRI